MEALIRFFIEVGKLKSVKRRGWILRGVKDPETIADHAFRVCILSWILGVDSKLNTRRILKLALVHSLSAVYIDYISPYDKLLNIKNKKELLKKYPALLLRAPIYEKGKIAIKRFGEEETAIKRLTDGLSNRLKHEIRYLWLDFQKKTSREAKLLWAADKLENLIQALEYKDQIKEDLIAPFLSQMGKITDDKQILSFANSIKEYFIKGEKGVRNRKNAHIIKFILEIGKLKKVKRVGWIYGGAKEKDTESVAGHSFRLAIMTGCLIGRKRFDLEKLLKMAIIHDLVIVYTGDITPFDDLITHDLKKDKKILETWPTGSKKDKEKHTIERRFKDRKAVAKLVENLPIKLQDEILSLWFEYEEGFSKEGRFVRQVDRIEKLLQAIEYKVKGVYKPNIDPYWVQLKVLLDEPVLVEFVEEVDKWFYGKNKSDPKLVDKLASAK